jgi:hypothetical protein
MASNGNDIIVEARRIKVRRYQLKSEIVRLLATLDDDQLEQLLNWLRLVGK